MFKKKEKTEKAPKNKARMALPIFVRLVNPTNAANIYFYRIALGSTGIIALSGLVSLVFSASLC